MGIIWNSELATTHKHRHPPLPPPGVGASAAPLALVAVLGKSSCHLSINDHVAAVLSEPLPRGGARAHLLPITHQTDATSFQQTLPGKKDITTTCDSTSSARARGSLISAKMDLFPPQHLPPPTWKNPSSGPCEAFEQILFSQEIKPVAFNPNCTLRSCRVLKNTDVWTSSSP